MKNKNSITLEENKKVELVEAWGKNGSYMLKIKANDMVLQSHYVSEVIKFDGQSWTRFYDDECKPTKAQVLKEYLENRF